MSINTAGHPHNHHRRRPPPPFAGDGDLLLLILQSSPLSFRSYFQVSIRAPPSILRFTIDRSLAEEGPVPPLPRTVTQWPRSRHRLRLWSSSLRRRCLCLWVAWTLLWILMLIYCFVFSFGLLFADVRSGSKGSVIGGLSGAALMGTVCLNLIPLLFF